VDIIGAPTIQITNQRRGRKMTLIEAIKTGKPHRRLNDNYVYFVPHVGGIAYSQEDVMADDWIVGDGKTSLLSNLRYVSPEKPKEEPAKVLNFIGRWKRLFKKD
jgi:hypothetical protein